MKKVWIDGWELSKLYHETVPREKWNEDHCWDAWDLFYPAYFWPHCKDEEGRMTAWAVCKGPWWLSKIVMNPVISICGLFVIVYIMVKYRLLGLTDYEKEEIVSRLYRMRVDLNDDGSLYMEEDDEQEQDQ